MAIVIMMPAGIVMMMMIGQSKVALVGLLGGLWLVFALPGYERRIQDTAISKSVFL